MRYLLILLSLAATANAQTNIFVTTPEAANVIAGNYNPATYAATTVIDAHSEIICGIQDRLSTDSLQSYLESMATFHNRNSGSDTVSSDTGIGAARRWALARFQKFSSDNQNRLLPAYVQFDQSICSMNQHKNVIAVLPGRDTANHGIIIIEGHLDSRCETGCDPDCVAQGIEDNGSGSALVMELARVMSKYTFNQTIVFMLTTAEEQGLLGANAFAQYCVDNNIPIKAVQNNDVVGGIYCGATASPPTNCQVEGEVDSLHTRIFSNGSFLKTARGMARWANMVYQEKLYPIAPVPMTLHVMNQEDRTGRGGDHIPFSDRGFASIRFCSANEHGNGAPGLGYTDRQHSVDDLLGVDTDLNGSIDSFFVDFNYLKRNSVINGATATMLGLGPEIPDFDLTSSGSGLTVTITSQTQYGKYRVGIHDAASGPWDGDFDAIYLMNGLTMDIPGLTMNTTYFVSVASVDADGLTSLFSAEKNKLSPVTVAPGPTDSLQMGFGCWPVNAEPLRRPTATFALELLPAYPNPTSHNTVFRVRMNRPTEVNDAQIVITDLAGKLVARIPIQLSGTVTTTTYNEELSNGLYQYSLVVNGKPVQTRKLIHTHEH